jgi:hypothetical protein
VVARASTPRSYAEKPRTSRAACTETAQNRDKRNVEGYLRASPSEGGVSCAGVSSSRPVALLAAPAAYALLGQHGVKTTRLYEQLPAAATEGSTNYFAWTQNSRSRRNHFDAFLTRTGDPRVKLNTSGEGFMGGIDPPLVAYQQIANGQSNLKLYKADDQTRPALPAGVNTPDWEWEPSISGDWLLFGRQTNNAQYVILHSLTTPTVLMLDQGVRFRHEGQMNGNFAVWTRCNRSTCNVVRRDILATTDIVLSKPPTKFQYSAAVTSTGIGLGRAKRAEVRNGREDGARLRRGRPARRQGRRRPRHERTRLLERLARDNADGSVDVFYDRYVCGTGKSDIYRINDPHPGP